MTKRSRRLKNSAYTPEEEERFDALLFTFRDYLDAGQDFFEVLYSEKLGRYVEVVLDKLLWQTEPLIELEGPEDLFVLLLCQMAADLAVARWVGEDSGPEFTPAELAETRRWAMGCLARMPDPALRRHFMGELDRFVGEEMEKARQYA